MKKPKILVVGSFVMDQIATTTIFPREGQTVLGDSFSKAPGGKGANQAVQMGLLGADVTMVGKIGCDSNGDEMLEKCRAAGVHVQHILRDADHPSGCSVIILEETAEKQVVNRIIVLPGANKNLSLEEVNFLKDQIEEYDLVVLQLEIPMEVNEKIAEYAFAKDVPVMLNSAPSAVLSEKFCSHIAYISPNEHEAYDMVGIQISHEGKMVNMDEAKAAADALKEKGVKNVLITLGDAGAILDTEEEGTFYSPCAENITAVDPTAAGDSFIGAFSVGLSCGWSYDDILRFANHTAALTVSKKGAMPSLPTLDEVEKFLGERTGNVPDTTVLKK